MNSSNWRLRAATAAAMFLTIILYFVQGSSHGALQAVLLVLQVLCGAATLVLALCVMFSATRAAAAPKASGEGPGPADPAP